MRVFIIIIILTNKSYINQIQQLTKESICVKDIETIVSVDEQKIIREDKNVEKIDEINRICQICT